MSTEGKHVFVSYVSEDSARVDKLCKVLERVNIPYWRDKQSLGPGDAWKRKIREAINSGAMVFLACFSDNFRARGKSYMYEELRLATEEYRMRPPDQKWLIPIRFDAGEIPDLDLGPGETLRGLQQVDLFGDEYAENAAALVDAIKQAMGIPGLDPATVRASVEEAADADRPAILRRLTKEMVLEEKRHIELDSLIAQEVSKVLAAIRDPERFPRQLKPGTGDERLLQLAALAVDYWRLVEPFCWSLNIAARWGAPTALTPWTKGLRAFCAEALKIEGGVQTINDLKHIPCLTAIFVAAVSSSGQRRWDNFKSLLVDTTVINPRRENQRVSVIEAESPWAAFSSWEGSRWIPHILARSADNNEDLDTAWSVLREGRVKKSHTPVADWLHAILRPVFDEQFPDDESYDSEFDAAEVMLGVVAEDLGKNRWFGRSTYRPAYDHGDPVEDLIQEQTAQGAAWAPLASGLFGGSLDRATNASSCYAETFHDLASKIPWG